MIISTLFSYFMIILVKLCQADLNWAKLSFPGRILIFLNKPEIWIVSRKNCLIKKDPISYRTNLPFSRRATLTAKSYSEEKKSNLLVLHFTIRGRTLCLIKLFLNETALNNLDILVKKIADLKDFIETTLFKNGDKYTFENLC